MRWLQHRGSGVTAEGQRFKDSRGCWREWSRRQDERGVWVAGGGWGAGRGPQRSREGNEGEAKEGLLPDSSMGSSPAPEELSGRAEEGVAEPAWENLEEIWGLGSKGGDQEGGTGSRGVGLGVAGTQGCG